MKHVRRLAAQPLRLKQYCLEHPAEPLRPANEADAAWTTFKRDKASYTELLTQLTRIQQGLCIYCEQRLVDQDGNHVPMDYQVEHVQPKSGAVGRVLDWTNLALACCGGTYKHHSDVSRKYDSKENVSCGQLKEDRTLGCDPRDLPLLDPVIEVGLDGRLSINTLNCARAGLSPEIVHNGISLLNLNCERLRKKRQDIADNARSWFHFMLAEIVTSPLTHAEQQAALDILVARRLRPDSLGNLPAFWSAERSAIGVPAETWLATHQTLFT